MSLVHSLLAPRLLLHINAFRGCPPSIKQARAIAEETSGRCVKEREGDGTSICAGLTMFTSVTPITSMLSSMIFAALSTL
jgi:hypothetical protein